ncbi:hypothetical protein [Pseudomonas sp. NBRC 111138]|uniref:hypothetical protein n=1 Tax=Pseudomonas sp. NBRC 111138 TaxID=1661053 RepID=UPI0006D4299C|nr:hypothetical protein [Pseudomonas sp. NBRC 111138]
MQTETTIIVIGLLIGWIATAFYLIKATQKAYARGLSKGLNGLNELHSQEVEGLRQDLQHQIELRNAEQARSEPPCTLADHALLTNVSATLRLAVETWQAFPGTETLVAKVTHQQRDLVAFAAKIWVSGYPTQSVTEDAA